MLDFLRRFFGGAPHITEEELPRFDINPATGLPMLDGIMDTDGNLMGLGTPPGTDVLRDALAQPELPLDDPFRGGMGGSGMGGFD